MPNHVTHKMVFNNEACDSLIMEMNLRKEKNSSGELLDFNFFVPIKGPWDYDDAIATHGTKWNAYNQNLDHLDEGYIIFDTAWSTAYPVWEAMTEQHPDVDITIYYADEDTGNNLGIIRIENGSISVEELSYASNLEKLECLSKIHKNYYGLCKKSGEIYCLEYPEDCEEE